MSSSSAHKTDIICLSLARWDAPISSPAVSLAKEFAKSGRVFFINHPYSFKDRLFDRTRYQSRSSSEDTKWKPDRDAVQVFTPPLTYPINFLPPGKVYDYFSSVNNHILIKALRKIITENQVKKYLFINFFDPFFLFSIPNDIKPEKYIYQCMDDITQVPYTKKHGAKLEEKIIHKADHTLCTSHELVRLRSSISGNVHFHPNAADTALFNQAFSESLNRPPDLHFPDKKIIGFTGSIEYRTDFRLLKSLAERHRDKIIYLIGPVYGDEHMQAGLDKIHNILFAGSRTLKELPAYLRHFDCVIIPYKKNTLTKSIYPLKINEYLAAGKPVVSTNFSEDIDSFREVAYIADNDEAFIHLIDKAILEDTEQKKQQRVNVAALNNWPQRVKEFWNIISPR